MFKSIQVGGKLESKGQRRGCWQGLHGNFTVWKRGGPALLIALGFVSACQIACSDVQVWLLQPRSPSQGTLWPIVL